MGSDIRFFIEGKEDDVIVSKSNIEFYHFTSNAIRALGPEDEILVQVSKIQTNLPAGQKRDCSNEPVHVMA